MTSHFSCLSQDGNILNLQQLWKECCGSADLFVVLQAEPDLIETYEVGS